MPVYIYKREDGTMFETLQSMKSEPLKECPDTGQPVERVITGGRGFQLTSRGFPSEQNRNKGKLRKALEKNPMHTTTADRHEHIQQTTKTRRQKILDMQKRKQLTGGKQIEFKQESVSIKEAPKVNPEVMKQLDRID